MNCSSQGPSRAFLGEFGETRRNETRQRARHAAGLLGLGGNGRRSLQLSSAGCGCKQHREVIVERGGEGNGGIDQYRPWGCKDEDDGTSVGGKQVIWRCWKGIKGGC